MKKNGKYIRWAILGVLFFLVLMVRFIPSLGEWYALRIYPTISLVLSSFSSLFPFSLGDIFISLCVIGLLLFPVYTWRNSISLKRSLGRLTEYLLWIYVWFYFAWGMNYFREDFYTRAQVKPVQYVEGSFRSFLNNYIRALNETYVSVKWINENEVEQEVMNGYRKINEKYGLAEPKSWQRVKTMLYSQLISKMGITGYMGPFFNEFNLNGDLRPVQYPSTYAHEMAHLLGVTSEAEANLYAYLICTRSEIPQIRFSGYFCLLGHVLSNASSLLSEEEYRRIVAGIRPEVIQLYEENRAYWIEKYSPTIGSIQDNIYDLFLKGNKIESGRKNYSEVIGLILSLNSPVRK